VIDPVVLRRDAHCLGVFVSHRWDEPALYDELKQALRDSTSATFVDFSIAANDAIRIAEGSLGEEQLVSLLEERRHQSTRIASAYPILH
jgi:hypothetical protein